MTKNSIIALMVASFMVTGCTSNNSTGAENDYWSKKSYQTKLTQWLHPYRIDVQQGNVITDEMRANLKVGMSKQQVKHVLGTSILSESYSKDEWLYVFNERANGQLNQEEVLVLTFKDDALSNIHDNVMVK